MSTQPTGIGALVVVPTYNEIDNLGSIIPAIFEALPDCQVLVVDDLSPDGTGQFAEKLRETYPNLHVEHRSGPRGLGQAYLHGFRWALKRDHQFIFEMDADFSHKPEYLPWFLRHAETADVVLGCRYMAGGGVEGWGWHRRLISRGGNLYARKVLGMPYHDLTGGFKCFRRIALETIDLNKVISNGYNFQIELTWLAHQAGLRIAEMPIIFPDRQVGDSKMNASIFHEALINVWKLRFRD